MSATRFTTSRSTSMSMPPNPIVMIGPQCGSSSSPGTSQPRRSGRPAGCTTTRGPKDVRSVRYAAPTAVPLCNPRITPPRSNLWMIPRSAVLSTTGNPSSRAARRASAAECERSVRVRLECRRSSGRPCFRPRRTSGRDVTEMSPTMGMHRRRRRSQPLRRPTLAQGKVEQVTNRRHAVLGAEEHGNPGRSEPSGRISHPLLPRR